VIYHMTDSTLPPSYIPYHSTLQTNIFNQYSLAQKAKAQGLDPSLNTESPLALDLADRVATLLEVPVADRLRELLQQNRTEAASFILANEIASGKYPLPEGQSPAEAAVRIGLAIVTDGVTVAPIQGVSAVRTKQNQNGSEYLSIEFAGPIRSAGGTESALTLVIADQVRKTLGLERYNPFAYDDEVDRFSEELRVYERDVGNFQYKVSDQDIQKAIQNLPVEIDGVWTDNYEVVVHRDMKRISTNRVRGGALRVLNDGIIGKSKKLFKLLNELNIQGWEWLNDLSGGKQQGTDETKGSSSHFEEVISGRPVLSTPGKLGGFRLRYGRAPNTGIHAVGIHPAVCTLLNFPVVMGTQIKVDMPGKGASIAIVDTLETPIVRLKDGTVVKISDAEQASSLAQRLDTILYLGDILISFGDFLENNCRLAPSAYVEEWWSQDLNHAITRRYSSIESCADEVGISKEALRAFTQNPLHIVPSFSQAQTIARTLQVPLHPRYLFYWDQITAQEVVQLRDRLTISQGSSDVTIRGDNSLKPTLEKLGIEHVPLSEEEVIITGEQALVLAFSLDLERRNHKSVPAEGWHTTPELVNLLCGVQIRNKSSVFVGVRVGRPEKAMPRKMRPPVQGLFPVGRSIGMSRDIMVASEKQDLTIELVNLECPKCGSRSTTSKCSFCDSETSLFKACIKCGTRSDPLQTKCPACGGQLRRSAPYAYPLKQELKKASLRLDYAPQKPLKGVLGLTNELKIPERLEKVLLRQKYDLSVYRDGTVRFDATNVPLTHFKPRQIQTNVAKLHELGYAKDINGQPLQNEDQTVELLMQDVVVPFEAGTFLVSVCKYIDDLLIHHYNMQPYYNVETPQDLIGHLIVGLAPHTSVGIVGRIVGYSNAQACFATPYWHSAKRRDCDGDGDSILLLMDILLNFSKKFLPSIIGGLMDAPLLIQPLILPKEVQRQAHHMDVTSSYPVEFYHATEQKLPPTEAKKYIELVKDRLGTEKQYCDFGFTHDTTLITVKQNRSSYSTLVTLTEKLDRQIEIAEKIRAVNPNEVVKSVLRTHLLPDIIGNTKAYTSQKFRCKDCSAKYRRMPIKGVCLSCGGPLQPSVTRGSVEKYLQLGLRLSNKYDVGEYLRSRFVLASEELATLFKPQGHQSDINDFMLAGVGGNQPEHAPPTETMPLLETQTSNSLGVDTHYEIGEDAKPEKSRKSRTVEQYQTTLF
jgi:DNA polymerase II large subunit